MQDKYKSSHSHGTPYGAQIKLKYARKRTKSLIVLSQVLCRFSTKDRSPK